MTQCNILLPASLEPRLQERYRLLVHEHLQTSQPLAPGPKALPAPTSTKAAAQAAWRFFNNPLISLPDLAQPLIAQAQHALERDCQHYGLVMHDWSCLTYKTHHSKKDRIQLKNRRHYGYEWQSALLVSDHTGQPLAPLVQNVRAQGGLYSTRADQPLKPLAHLEELTERMDYLAKQGWTRPLVHLVDREADSVGHYRRWIKRNHQFVVRAKGCQRVQWEGQEWLLSQVVDTLRQQQRLQFSREVRLKGQPAWQYVAETALTLTRPARHKYKARGKVRSRTVAGEPIQLRLIVSDVRDAQGKVLATWLLLTNVAASVTAEQIALWYYWRWEIESFFKLVKSAGHQLESWQQETGLSLARRLLVASMACVLVWQVARDPSPQAAELRQGLVRLSGRQMKHGTAWTMPALLAGTWTLLAMLALLKEEELHRLQELAHRFFGGSS
jgi:hypothetical protein